MVSVGERDVAGTNLVEYKVSNQKGFVYYVSKDGHIINIATVQWSLRAINR